MGEATSGGGRIAWLDILRGLGIVAVALGHSPGLPEAVHKYLYAFHMPLFFFASGLVFRLDAVALPLRQFAARLARRLLVPYLFFSVASYLFWLLIRRHFGKGPSLDIDPLKPLLGIPYGTQYDQLLVYNHTLWFFTAMFLAQMIFLALLKYTRRTGGLIAGLAFCALVGYAFSFYGGVRPPWSLDTAFTAVAFIGLGHLFREKIFGLSTAGCWGLVAVCLPLSLVAASLNSDVDMTWNRYGNIAWFYTASLAGTLFCLGLSRLLAHNRVLEYLGRNSIIFFPLHVLAFAVVTAALVFMWHLPHTVKYSSWLFAPLYTMVGLAVVAPVVFFINRWFPWIIGKPRKAGR